MQSRDSGMRFESMKTEYEKIQPFTTKDGSLVRELMHPKVHGNSQQSLAEALVPVGAETLMHRHHFSEEIYHVSEGTGVMTLGKEQFEIKKGDTVCILPGMIHRVENTGTIPLRILCCCSPAYAHEDTELVQ
jgi:mannose-6-phosphate isomerase-like protein (cupin superfamily)